jgi:hypothetical protein
MPDSRGGNAYYLGQCATGKDLEDKAGDLNIEELKDFLRTPDALPCRSLSTPHYVFNPSHVRYLSKKGGLFFDRLRIVKLLSNFNDVCSKNRKSIDDLVNTVRTT